MISRPDALERYFERNFAPFFLREQLLEGEWMLPPHLDFRTVFPDCLLREATDIVSQVMYWETTANLTGDLLVKVDRMSMANSLEVRCPLLDHFLAGLAASIPNGWKIRQGRGKDILIRAMAARLPPELLSRPKRGFAVPLADWFRHSLRELLRDHLAGSRFPQRGVVSAGFVHKLIEEHERGRRDNSSWLWSLLMLEMWFREFESETSRSPRAGRVEDAGQRPPS
jgi:asparagine synthase (glutamine-hydrolysing)